MDSFEQSISFLMDIVYPRDEVDEEHDGGDENIEHVSIENMRARHVLSPPDAHPPNVDHGVIAAVLVVQIIQDPGNMTVAIVTEDVVHSLSVG